MSKRFLNLFLGLLLAAGLAACREGSGVFEPTATAEGTELDLMVDQDLTDAIVGDAEAALDAVAGGAGGVSPAPGVTPPDEATIEQARELLRQARELFRQARQAWRAGDTETAARLAEQARLRVAEALVLVFGEEAYDHLYQRVNNVISWLEAQVDEGTSQLLGRIRELRNDAEQIRAQDPSGEAALIRATERLLLALQIAHRERSRQRMGEMAQHALFSVFMGDAALDLASTVVGEDPSEAQQHLLGHGSRLLERALEALSLGRYRLAFNLAREAMNVALVAVLLEPGPEEDKAAWMITVSNDAIAAAQAAVTGAGLGPTDFPVRLLELAVELQGNGIEVLANRPRVGIEILWYAAVTAQGVVNMVNAG